MFFISFICTLLVCSLTFAPSNSDPILGLPIAIEVANPGTYSIYDLLVSSGLHSPFYLYKSASILYGYNFPIEIIWHFLFFISTMFTFYSLFYLFKSLNINYFIIAIALMMLSIAPSFRGTLNWTSFPVLAFVTSSLVAPFSLFAIGFTFKKRYFLSALFGGISFCIHPYIGLITMSALILLSYDHLTFKRFIMFNLFMVVICIPNVVYILFHLKDNFLVSNYVNNSLTYFNQFKMFAAHVYIEDHWNEGYGWFLLAIAMAKHYGFEVYKNNYKYIKKVFVFWMILSSLYILNAYFIGVKSILLTYFFRFTLFIKPFIFIIFSYILIKYTYDHNKIINQNTYYKYIPSILIIFAVLINNTVIAELSFMILFYIFYLDSRKSIPIFKIIGLMGLFFIICFLFNYSYLNNMYHNYIHALMVAAIFVCVFIYLTTNRSDRVQDIDEKSIKIRKSKLIPFIFTLLIVIILFTFYEYGHLNLNYFKSKIEKQIYFQRPSYNSKNLFSWILKNTNEGSLFIIPPYSEDFKNFRLAARRSPFITIYDINQLAFDSTVYSQAYERLMALKINVINMRTFDTSQYFHLTLDQITSVQKTFSADYYITTSHHCRSFDINHTKILLYMDEHYCIVNTRTVY